ncbi:MAG: alpha/beta hydrolase [Solirubrobacterales bacterium]
MTKEAEGEAEGELAAAITERTITVGGIDVFVRERPGDGAPAVFVHGNPTSSWDWLPFLERMRGPALAFDLPGFGRSDHPPAGAFDHSLGGYADFVERLLEQEIDGPYRLVVHDWGGIALAAAQRNPERVERLVVMDAVPFNADYRWHWIGRLWRRRRVGEALIAMTSKHGVRQLLRLARPGRKPMPEAMIEEIWSCWDEGMARAVLALYRSADPEVLAATGARIGEITCPALVLWATEDPYIGVEQGRWYAAALPGAELELVEGAGHWLWIDRPDVVDRVVGYLEPPG